MTIMGGTIAQLVNNRGIKADGKFTKHKHIKAVIVGQVPISKKALPYIKQANNALPSQAVPLVQKDGETYVDGKKMARSVELAKESIVAFKEVKKKLKAAANKIKSENMKAEYAKRTKKEMQFDPYDKVKELEKQIYEKRAAYNDADAKAIQLARQKHQIQVQFYGVLTSNEIREKLKLIDVKLAEVQKVLDDFLGIQSEFYQEKRRADKLTEENKKAGILRPSDGDAPRPKFYAPPYRALTRDDVVIDNLDEFTRKSIQWHGKTKPITKWTFGSPKAKERWIETLDKTLKAAEPMQDPKDLNRSAPPPTQSQTDAIFAYTATSICQSANATLRGMVADKTIKPKAIKVAEQIREGLRATPSFKGDVYRGVKLAQDVASQIKVGSTYQDFGFMSTSYSYDSAEGFLVEGMATGKSQKGDIGAMFVIKGKHSGKLIEGVSPHDSEKEVLFDAGSKFKVTKIVNRKELGYPEIHLEQIDDPNPPAIADLVKEASAWQKTRKAIGYPT